MILGSKGFQKVFTVADCFLAVFISRRKFRTFVVSVFTCNTIYTLLFLARIPPLYSRGAK